MRVRGGEGDYVTSFCLFLVHGHALWGKKERETREERREKGMVGRKMETEMQHVS